MDSVDVALDRVWPGELRTDRLLLRPVTRTKTVPSLSELLTDDPVRAHLGGPATEERVAAPQAASPKTAGTWAVVRVADTAGRSVWWPSAPTTAVRGAPRSSTNCFPSVWGLRPWPGSRRRDRQMVG